MMSKMKAVVLAIGLGLGAAVPGQAYWGTTYLDNESVNSPYSFDFQIRGAPNAQPVQVFTDEYETYIEMPSGVTAHYVMVGGNRVRLSETPPYVMFDGSPREFFLRTSHGEVEVIRRGDSTLGVNLAAGDRRVRQDGCEPICAPRGYVLRAGTLLSESLRRYVKTQGWNALRWNIDHDYLIEDDIPLHGDMQTAVTGLVRAYQAQGGLMGVTPRFAEANRVVVFEPVDMSGDFSRNR